MTINRRKWILLGGCVLAAALVLLLILALRGEDDGSIRGRWGQP